MERRTPQESLCNVRGLCPWGVLLQPPVPSQLDSVLWAELEVPNGTRKVRPVVVSPTADVKAGEPVRVVAISLDW
jgi:hypothetical protein